VVSGEGSVRCQHLFPPGFSGKVEDEAVSVTECMRVPMNPLDVLRCIKGSAAAHVKEPIDCLHAELDNERLITNVTCSLQ
jgi:hypothetical protein